jgi:hypothetical protein
VPRFETTGSIKSITPTKIVAFFQPRGKIAKELEVLHTQGFGLHWT